MYLSAPVTEGVLHAEGRLLEGFGKRYVGEAVLTVGGQQVARGTGSFLRSKLRLADTPGYA